MRDVPDHITKAIHDRDPLASVKWDDCQHTWILYWDGVKICNLFHADGKDMIELCVDEILDIMGRYDNYNDGMERIKAMRRSASEAKRKAEERKKIMIEESMKETEKVTDVMVNGVSPQVHIQNNPICKENLHAN